MDLYYKSTYNSPPPIVTIVTAGTVAIIERRKYFMSDEKKKEAQKSIYLQYDGKEISIDAVEKAVRENYDSIKKGEDPPEDIRVYLKPEDRKAYYVINSDFAGEVDLLVD